MISFDTNILFASLDSTQPLHQKARTFLENHIEDNEVCLCEQVLMELYCLLRNPSVCKNPLPAPEAVAIIQTFRSNPHWRIVDVQPEPPFMHALWENAATPSFAFRKIFDLRLSKTLQQHGVTDFATRNLKDFQSAGFRIVWDPLKSENGPGGH